MQSTTHVSSTRVKNHYKCQNFNYPKIFDTNTYLRVEQSRLKWVKLKQYQPS